MCHQAVDQNSVARSWFHHDRFESGPFGTLPEERTERTCFEALVHRRLLVSRFQMRPWQEVQGARTRAYVVEREPQHGTMIGEKWIKLVVGVPVRR